VETPDYDAAAHQVEMERGGGAHDIFAFPRGARAGRCLHAIFEQVNFTALARASLERLVARELAAHDFAARWIPVVADMVQAVVTTPLDASGRLRLDCVSADRRFDELEFYYPVASLSDGGLRAILLEGGFPDEIRERIGTFTFAPARGFMKGFIDLVFEADGRFYLADYKSNWLGASLDDYRQDNLNRVMAREAYYLQYLIYCVALHRYLAARVPGYDYETHFGGVRYLFLRGMRPEMGIACGIYADRPARGLIDALDGYLRTG
jgi:exodeoxyribonuclease V beta subunit